MTQPGRPAVFVHGLWLHASSWGPWLELFREAGYAPVAPGWPGDADTVAESLIGVVVNRYRFASAITASFPPA